MVTTTVNGVSLGTSGGAIVKDTKCGFAIGRGDDPDHDYKLKAYCEKERISGSGTAMTILG